MHEGELQDRSQAPMPQEVYMAILRRRELPIGTLKIDAGDAIAGTTWKGFLGKVRGLCVRAAFGGYELITEWRRRVRMRDELTTLSDLDLRDFGWTRGHANLECRKPFWRA
jgi:uncharacterized protein YjiS (DUF1127 family)